MSKNKAFGVWAGTYICTVMLGIAISAAYINLEEPVYYWDYAAYFNVFNQQGALLVEDPFNWLNQVGTSIATQDYG
ncbi:hypothetical protein EOA35_35060, partial [Mesorhizobium sp. M8A.F.Ca.ET.023.01.1.1]